MPPPLPRRARPSLARPRASVAEHDLLQAGLVRLNSFRICVVSVASCREQAPAPALLPRTIASWHHCKPGISSRPSYVVHQAMVQPLQLYKMSLMLCYLPQHQATVPSRWEVAVSCQQIRFVPCKFKCTSLRVRCSSCRLQALDDRYWRTISSLKFALPLLINESSSPLVKFFSMFFSTKTRYPVPKTCSQSQDMLHRT